MKTENTGTKKKNQILLKGFNFNLFKRWSVITAVWTSSVLGTLNTHAGAENMKEDAFWGNEISGWKLKILFIGFDPAMHDVFLLAKRFNIYFDIVATGSLKNKGASLAITTYYWPELFAKSEDEVSDIIRKKLSFDWDLIVITPVPSWASYPEDIRDKLMEKVRNGVSMVFFYLSGNPMDKLKEKLSEKIPYCCSFMNSQDSLSPEIFSMGKGKIAFIKNLIDYRLGFMTSPSGNRALFEYKMTRFMRFINCFAKDLNGLIEGINITKENNCEIKLRSATEGNLNILICNEDGETEKNASLDVSNDSLHYTINIQPLPNGKQYVFIYLKDKKGSLMDWGGLWIDNYNSLRVKTVSCKNSELKTGDTLSLEYEFEGQRNSTCRAEFTLEDSRNRIYIKKQFDTLQDKIDIIIPDTATAVVNFAVLKIYRDNCLLEKNKIEFTLPDNIRKEDFYILAWNSGVGTSWRAKEYLDLLKSSGIDGLTNMSNKKNAAAMVARANMLTVPYAAAFHNVTLKENLFNTKWIEKSKTQIKESIMSHRPYGGFAFTLGDENYVSPFKKEGRFADDPEIWSEFQEYLKKQYNSLEVLNRQWDAQFENWNDIRFKNEAEMLKIRGNPSSWVDFRMFVSSKFIGIQKELKDIVKETSPKSFVGWDGCEQFSSYDGYDLWDYVNSFDLTNIYARYLVPHNSPNKIFNGHCVRSFSVPGSLKGVWMNSIDPVLGTSYALWYALFNGYNSAWWWHATFMGTDACALGNDGTPTQVFAGILKEVKEIKNGTAAMLLHSVQLKDPVAIHYSANNWHASTLSSGTGAHINNLGIQYDMWFSENLIDRYVKCDNESNDLWKNISPAGHYAPSSKNFITLFHDLGYSPNMLARQQIETGLLKDYKLLILPFVESLSEKEADEIKSFVAKGGTLIADYRCGIRDYHCKIRENGGILDEVFGIKQKKGAPIKRQKREFRVDSVQVSGKSEFIFSEPDIEMVTAKALGCDENGNSVFFINEYGKGKTLFCNFDIFNYYDSRRNGQEVELRELFRGFLIHFSNIGQKAVARKTDGNVCSQLQVFNYQDGPVFYTGAIKDFICSSSTDEMLVLPLPIKGHVYDARAHKYLGYRDTAIVSIFPGKAVLLAIYPSEIKGISLKMPKEVMRGSICKIRIKTTFDKNTPSVVPSVVTITVLNPQGKEIQFLSRTVYMDNGMKQINIPIALNDPTGLWTIKVKDAASGVSNSFSFIVTDENNIDLRVQKL